MDFPGFTDSSFIKRRERGRMIRKTKTPNGSNIELSFIIAVQTYLSPYFDAPALFGRSLITDLGMTLILPVFVWTMTPSKGLLIVCSCTFTELLNGLLKWFVRRPRPFWVDTGVRNIAGAWESDFSFPSSHSQITFAMLFMFMMEYSVVGLIYYCVLFAIFFMGAARVYLGVHYPSDVLSGWLLGLIVPYLLDYYDVMRWFGVLPAYQRLLLCVIFPVAVFGLFELVRAIGWPVSEQEIQIWEKRARISGNSSNKSIQALRAARYIHPVFTTVGGLLGASLAMEDTSLPFIHEQCLFQDFFSVTLWRWLVGMAGLLFVFGPCAFVLPSLIEQSTNSKSDDLGRPRHSSRSSVALAVKCISSIGLGLWLSFGAPKASETMFGLSCQLYREDSIITQPLRARIHDLRKVCKLDRFATNRIPSSVERINSLNQLIQLVKSAPTKNQKIRVVGAGHSQIFLQDKPYGAGDEIRYISLSSPAFQQYKVIRDDNRVFVISGAGLHLGANP